MVIIKSWALAITSFCIGGVGKSLYRLGLAPREPAWRFDLSSALIGFVAGALVSLVLYLLRHRLAALRDSFSNRAAHLKDRLSTGVEDRYREQVVYIAEYTHLLKHYAPLSKVYVSPDLFVPPVTLPRAFGDEHEHGADQWRDEYLYDSLYPSPETVHIGDALKQSRRLAILGAMGSGRTTFLLYLAHQFALREGWRFTFDEPQETDSVELQADRKREQERLPVWIPLEALDFSQAQSGGRHALLKPITDYLGSSLPVLIAAPSAVTVRTRIVEGKCLLLFDNLDMLDAQAYEQALSWMNDLCRTYVENTVVVSGTQRGYGALLEKGFAALMLEGFQRPQMLQFVERWESLRTESVMAEWEAQAAEAQKAYEAEKAAAAAKGLPPPAEPEPPEIPAPARGLLALWTGGRREHVMPLDLSLAAILWREQDAIPSTRLMCFAQAVVIAIGHTQDSLLSPPHWARVLGEISWRMHSEARYEARRDELEKGIAQVLSQFKPLTASSAETEVVQEGGEQASAAPNWERLGRAALNALLETGDLLTDAGRGHINFVHPTFRAYFAAQHAARSGQPGLLLDHVRDPRWQETILFYATLSSVAPLVVERLKGEDDIHRSNFFTAARYLLASPEADKQLLGGVLAELAQIFLNPAQPTTLRRQAGVSIAQAESKGALYLFGQALQHADPHVRCLGVWGLVQLDDDRTWVGLEKSLRDPDPLVRVEVLRAMGRRGDEKSLEGLLQGLQDQDDLPRRVAAEALAAFGEQGHEVLQEAVESEDMYIRRAALYGVGKVKEPWALEIVDRMSREDQEWFVRSAAVEILEKLRAGASRITATCDLEQAAWLTRWATRQNRALGTGDAPMRLVFTAAEEGDWTVKLAAAGTLRACGDQRAIPVLRGLLNHTDLLVRDAAYAALGEIGKRTGEHILLQKKN